MSVALASRAVSSMEANQEFMVDIEAWVGGERRARDASLYMVCMVSFL